MAPVSIDMKRAIDILISFTMLVVFGLPMVVIGLLIKLTSSGPVFYWSKRIGRDNIEFNMPKFRTMAVFTPQLATHLMTEPERFLTPIGKLLRKTSLDEIPQLISILRGDMSLVGPRPALFNQDDLISLRTAEGVHRLVPGLTGWAQVNGRDNLSMREKVLCDKFYADNASLMLDFRILVMTVVQAIRGEGVTH